MVKSHTTCNVAATMRCREGWERGDSVYWTRTVWLRARVRTMAARSLSLHGTYQCAWVGLLRVLQTPRRVTKLTVSIEWDLFSTYGKVQPGFTYTCGSFQSAYSTGEATQVVKPLWAFVREWNNLWQISNLSNRRRQRLQVSHSYGTPLKTSSMLERDVPQENWGTLIGTFRELRNLQRTEGP